MYLCTGGSIGSGIIIGYYNYCGDNNNICMSLAQGHICVQGWNTEKLMVPKSTNYYASQIGSRGGGGGHKPRGESVSLPYWCSY